MFVRALKYDQLNATLKPMQFKRKTKPLLAGAYYHPLESFDLQRAIAAPFPFLSPKHSKTVDRPNV
jgi:hypothetical protein